MPMEFRIPGWGDCTLGCAGAAKEVLSTRQKVLAQHLRESWAFCMVFAAPIAGQAVNSLHVLFPSIFRALSTLSGGNYTPERVAD